MHNLKKKVYYRDRGCKCVKKSFYPLDSGLQLGKWGEPYYWISLQLNPLPFINREVFSRAANLPALKKQDMIKTPNDKLWLSEKISGKKAISFPVIIYQDLGVFTLVKSIYNLF